MRGGGDDGPDDDDVCSRLLCLKAFLLAGNFEKMADSKMARKMSPDEDHSLAVSGMAWRVKYRQTDENGKVMKIVLDIGSLGVHQQNRGSLYPAGRRCKNLCIDVLEVGFVKENVDHQLVAVEEIPREVARSRGPNFESGSQYNIRQCQKDEFLKSCFEVPYNDVRGLMLSHNRMMLVLRACLLYTSDAADE